MAGYQLRNIDYSDPKQFQRMVDERETAPASCDSPESSIAPAYGSKAPKQELEDAIAQANAEYDVLYKRGRESGIVHRPGGVTWCTDGQGTSWMEGSVDLHWSVVFFSGFFVGAVAVWGLWYVW